MKVTVLGSTGMLGSMTVAWLKNAGHEVRGVGRDIFELYPTTESVIGVKLYRATDDDTQYVINCIGAIKPSFGNQKNLLTSIYTNAIFPRQLADVCEKANRKLINITTDCVFDGREGPYDETREHNATDEYGKSKSLGEPANCLNIRTSIIGPEVGGRKRSLFEWVLSQGGKTVNGFMNHQWNGLTTLELAKIFERIMTGNLFRHGTYHIFSTDISKDLLVGAIAASYKIPLLITTVNAPQSCDRRLRTVKDLQEKVKPASLETMLEELVTFK